MVWRFIAAIREQVNSVVGDNPRFQQINGNWKFLIDTDSGTQMYPAGDVLSCNPCQVLPPP